MLNIVSCILGAWLARLGYSRYIKQKKEGNDEISSMDNVSSIKANCGSMFGPGMTLII